MASRLVTATLILDGVEGVITGFKKAGAGAVEYGRVAQKAGATAGAWVDKHRNELDSMGGSFLKVGAVGALALGGLVKSAIDWESAWAGVTKTVDGTPEQLASIEQGLRDMTKVLPASHEELAAVAEAAGQLGVQTDDILGFTRTMVDLGETTNLSSDEAATSLQQLMNVMGTAGKDVSRLGSTVVALGNNGASTERDIVQMGQRIAAAGSQVGMTETDVLAFAGALASVGVEAEAGGSAISLTFKQIDEDVREGGESLDLIAKTAGMTAEEFAAAWRGDAAGAMVEFVEGMGGMMASGEDVNGMLGELGISGIRQTDSLLRLAGATKAAGTEQDLLREQLDLAGIAWDENSALAAEAAQRYETPAAQAQMAINSIKDEAITLGQTLLPVFDAIVSGISNAVSAFSDMPGPIKDVGLGILAIGTAGALAVGGTMKLVAGLASAKRAIQALGLTMRTFTLSAGIIGIALTAAGVALSAWMGKQAEAKAKTDAYTAAIKEQGEVIGQATRDMAGEALQTAGVLDLAEQYGANLADVTDAALGSAEAMARVRSQIEGNTDAIQSQIDANQRLIDSNPNKTDADRLSLVKLQEANAGLNAELANRRQASDMVAQAIEKESGHVQVATDKALQLERATGEGADASQDAAAAAQAHAEAEAQRSIDIETATQAMAEAVTEAQAYGNALLALSGSQIGVEAAIDAATEALKENGETLNLDTEKGRENQQALNGIASASMSYIETLHNQGASTAEITAATQKARDAFVDTAEKMGMAESEAEALADAYFAMPSEVGTWLKTQGLDFAHEQLDEWDSALQSLSEEERTEFYANLNGASADEVQRQLDNLAKARRANIDVYYVQKNLPPAAADRLQQQLNRAYGGVVDYFATGGFGRGRDIANRHVAEIAPAGAWRVFAEPETEGEAYIPFRRDTRARSLQIWAETGRRLGVPGYAHGHISGGGASSTTYGDTHVHITQNFPGVDDVVTIRNAWQDAARQAKLKRGR